MQCLKPILVFPKGVPHVVPCSRCAFCLTNRRSQWMFRIHHEMRVQEVPGHFLTLTYDEKHVRRVSYVDPVSGANVTRLSLRFRDVQLFLKCLRKAKYYAKYICVGEYGPLTSRPHYHIILWTDCPATKIESIWKRGAIHFGRVTMQSAMYCLKYIIQPKQRDEFGIEPTRAQFSKGLGLAYLDKAVYNYHTFDYDEPVMTSRIDGQLVALPRYYKNKIFTKFQMRREASRIKSKRLKDETIQYRDLRFQGITKIRPYLRALRIDEARRIMKSTKFNQKL